MSVISETKPETIYCIVESYISDWGGHQMNVDAYCSFFSLCDNIVANYIVTPSEIFSFWEILFLVMEFLTE
jgi:hypothetical protein